MFRHHELKSESKRIRCIDIVIHSIYVDICTILTGLDCHGIRFQTVMVCLNGIAVLVKDLHSEGTVIVAYDCRDNRNAEIVHILLDRI